MATSLAPCNDSFKLFKPSFNHLKLNMPTIAPINTTNVNPNKAKLQISIKFINKPPKINIPPAVAINIIASLAPCNDSFKPSPTELNILTIEYNNIDNAILNDIKFEISINVIIVAPINNISAEPITIFIKALTVSFAFLTFSGSTSSNELIMFIILST